MTDRRPMRADSRFDKFRDSLAHAIANTALRTIATPWYCAMLDGLMRLGSESAARTELWKNRLLVELLDDLHDYCDRRIKNGDLDFDDWVYKSRKLSKELADVIRRFNYEVEETR